MKKKRNSLFGIATGIQASFFNNDAVKNNSNEENGTFARSSQLE